MARSFDGTSTWKIVFGSVAPVASNFSGAAWVNLNGTDDSADDHRIVFALCQQDDESANFYFFIGNYAAANDTKIGLGYITEGVFDYIETESTSELSLTGWQHIGFTNDGTNTRYYINGTLDNTVAHSSFPVSETYNFEIGLRRTDATDQAMIGHIAEVAYWQRVLTTAEMVSLASGFSPRFYPNSLKVYAPLIGKYSPEIDIMGTAGTGTVTGATTEAHPRIIYPQGSF